MDDLLTALFEDKHHPLASPLANWLASSRRFSHFVSNFDSKIRKKLRLAQNEEQQQELLLELETAFLLLEEKAFSLTYEPLISGQARSPDFLVSYTSSRDFFLEVTRLRSKDLPKGTEVLSQERFSTMLTNKLGQLQTQESNVLIVQLEQEQVSHSALDSALRQIQQRAERNDPKLIERSGFKGRKQFFNHFQRLSSVVLRNANLSKSADLVVWNNPQARHPLNPKIKTLLLHSHQTKSS